MVGFCTNRLPIGGVHTTIPGSGQNCLKRVHEQKQPKHETQGTFRIGRTSHARRRTTGEENSTDVRDTDLHLARRKGCRQEAVVAAIDDYVASTIGVCCVRCQLNPRRPNRCLTDFPEWPGPTHGDGPINTFPCTSHVPRDGGFRDLCDHSGRVESITSFLSIHEGGSIPAAARFSLSFREVEDLSARCLICCLDCLSDPKNRAVCPITPSAELLALPPLTTLSAFHLQM